MATIAKTGVTYIRMVYPEQGFWPSYPAGETVAAGDPVAFDTDASSNYDRVWKLDATDPSRNVFVGFALEAQTAGNPVRVAHYGVISGFTLTPSSEATHKPGNFVYSGAAGLVTNVATGVGVQAIGRIVPIGDTGKYGIQFDSGIANGASGQDAVNLAPQYVSAADPAATNDTTEGYNIGDMWYNSTTGREFVLTDATEDTAVWRGRNITHVEAGDPDADNDTDEGYIAGDVWVNSGDAGVFIAISVADGAANWDELAKA